MSLSTVLEYNKPEQVKTNKVLMEIARKVVNSSPEPRYKIKLRDEVLAMKEKERLGFNFNRSVTASLRSRWDVVEKATRDYLQEIVDMNDQIEEDGRKYENQLINLIVTRTTNLGLNSRIEQMAGLFMHMNFYCTVLKFKIQHLEPTRAFMFTCSDLMGFSRPSQIIDRYAALQHVFAELYADYETRQNLLNRLTETLSEVKAEINHRNMLMHNQMAEMHTRIKQLQTESAQLERAIQDQMDISTGASLEIYKIKNSVYNIYITMMNYRGLEATQIDSFLQLEELEVRISQTQAAVRMLQTEEARRQNRRKNRKKAEVPEDAYSVEAYSDKSDDYDRYSMDDNANRSANMSARLPAASLSKMSSKADRGPAPSLRGDQRRRPRSLCLPRIVGNKAASGGNRKKTGCLEFGKFPPLDGSSSTTCERQAGLTARQQHDTGLSTEHGGPLVHVVVSTNKCEPPENTSTNKCGPSGNLIRQAPSATGSSASWQGSAQLEESITKLRTRFQRQFSGNCRLALKTANESPRTYESHMQNQWPRLATEVAVKTECADKIEHVPVMTRPGVTREFPDVLSGLDSELFNAGQEEITGEPDTCSPPLKYLPFQQASTKSNTCSKARAVTSSSLKEISAKRTQVLSQIASRRYLKQNCLNILANVKL